ncbi:MAG: penicillin-binding protein 1B [Thermodesulfobacteriota bacterium]|nr:penicillin-binding protein 1B [Thermodesulfobacteriota bacterium]
MKKTLFALSLILLVLGGYYALNTIGRLNEQITSRFEGRRWELPARIYARPLDLYAGKELLKKQLQQELALLQYTETEQLEKPGEYRISGNIFTIHSRDIHFPDGRQTAAIIELTLANDHISSLTDLHSKQQLSLFRLEPLLIASIYPGDNEDRLLIQLKDAPILLSQTLILIEDKKFYQHIGVRPLAILRALLANLKAGKTVQGGSTLTQQLVKNFFLSSEQSIQRKLNEAVMALLLEYHYQKDEILEAYLNEIYLGQDGKRAIHGFAMASRFYFERNIDELSPDQIALLVGIAKGASFYNPRKHPQRARARRNLILENMGQAGLLAADAASQLQATALGVSKRISSGITPYPAFVQLVRRQLKRDYRDQDLQSKGLSIFTTFDPVIQQQAEKSLQQVLADIEQERQLTKETLQGAFVLCSADQGEVLAVVGDRFPARAGFNRALDMKRPVGSVIKPAVYLNALSRPETYNLLTTLYDTPLTIPVTGKDWEPKNYDKKFHGPVPLQQALVHSLNVATVQLGIDLGLDAVIATLHSLGITEEILPFPSLLLGAVELPPITILQMYQTIAAGGYKTPLRTILAVTDRQNQLLQRYPLTVKQTAEPGAVFCLSTALQEVCRTGTAKNLQQLLPPVLTVAGKTGTTDQLRDSWFAGFSDSHVAVAWVGRDDNKPTSLTGSSGAMRVWAETMGKISTTPLNLVPPANIDLYFSDTQTGKLFSKQCQQGELIPFIRGGLLPPVINCQAAKPSRQQSRRTQDNSLKKVMQDGLQQFLRIFQ